IAKQGSPVIAVNDGKIVKVGYHDKKLGNYVELQDATGNIYTYAQLGSIPKMYPVPRPVRVSAGQIAKELSHPTAGNGKPVQPATAGQQQGPSTPTQAQATATTRNGPISLPVSAPAKPQPAASK